MTAMRPLPSHQLRYKSWGQRDGLIHFWQLAQ
jgi:hypothetical protein